MPPSSTNAFEVLRDEHSSTEDTQQNDDDVKIARARGDNIRAADELPMPDDGVKVTRKKKKKKKQSKDKADDEEQVAELVDRIESAIPAAPTNQCALPKCQVKTGVLGVVCEFCKRKFCMAHRHPESHSSRCAELKQSAERVTHRRDASLIIEANKRDPGVANRVGGIQKERQDAKRRLQERIERATLDRKAKDKGKK
ncbi:hypothetical protein SpCBS45565_g04582 [Spizellomyces sp. 'palustris']|nr:hypothetical protein SpCBS45565_g04582 [Spizellomyces sp. 'palustris']